MVVTAPVSLTVHCRTIWWIVIIACAPVNVISVVIFDMLVIFTMIMLILVTKSSSSVRPISKLYSLHSILQYYEAS